MKPVNTARVRKPTWTGKPGEYAVVVSRGEPRRTDLQMEQAVAEQVRDYLLHYTKVKINDMVIALTVQLIAKDHITPVGKQAVLLQREHLIKYVELAKKQLGELEEGERSA